MLTRIQAPSLKDILGGNISKERLAPIHLHLRDDDEHADENGKDLNGRRMSMVGYKDGSKERRTETYTYHSRDEPLEQFNRSPPEGVTDQ